MVLDFKTATDRLSPCITQEAIADAADVSRDTIKRAKYPPGHDYYRPPPTGWQRVLARLAREKADDLLTVATELEQAGKGLEER